jgi:hypothetical protein
MTNYFYFYLDTLLSKVDDYPDIENELTRCRNTRPAPKPQKPTGGTLA